MTEPFIPYARQSINEADKESILEALSRDVITRGDLVNDFEQAVAKYCGAAYAVAFSTGSTALAAAAYAAHITPADRVLTTPNTFVATAGAALHQGADPVFIDIDRETGNVDLEQLFHNFEFDSSRGRLVFMPVHFSGIPVDMKKVYQAIKRPDFVIIEDAAHALGSLFDDGQKVGSCAWSAMTIFSFHPAKQITTGEGGMVTTNDPELDYRLRLYRNNGIVRDPVHLKGSPAPWYYEVQEMTGNYNFTDFQAALGLSQLKRLDQFIAKRRQLVALYRQELKDFPGVKLFTDAFDERVSFHLFVVQIDFKAFRTTREKVMGQLKSEGIGTQVHYIPVYRHPFFQKYTTVELNEYFPQMEGYYDQALSLPLYPDLSESDVKRVCLELKSALRIR
jgi:UDP-4-amino-4,6-dideoxy-L-N-acetyl-beta-L-altrosamine transaminase